MLVEFAYLGHAFAHRVTFSVYSKSVSVNKARFFVDKGQFLGQVFFFQERSVCSRAHQVCLLIKFSFFVEKNQFFC